MIRLVIIIYFIFNLIWLINVVFLDKVCCKVFNILYEVFNVYLDLFFCKDFFMEDLKWGYEYVFLYLKYYFFLRICEFVVGYYDYV